jgi:hypothetical protein
VDRGLLRTAEAGVGRLDEPARQRFRGLAAELERVGLTELGRGLGELEVEAERAAAVIRNGYLCRLHRQCALLTLVGEPGG